MSSLFREAKNDDGTPGPVSMRRVLAFLLVFAAIGLFAGAFMFASSGWYVFIGGIACLSGALLLLFFTTWADVAQIVGAWKAK